MNKDNIFIDKLKSESNREFENCVAIIESDIEIKKIFYYFLFYDMINIEHDNPDIDINDVINNPSNIIHEYLDNTYSKILNYNNTILSELKKEIEKKILNIQSKINECNSHIDIIKKEYINLSLQKYLPINNTKNLFTFENKTVLRILNRGDYELILGEFFTRYMMCSVKKIYIELQNPYIDIQVLFNEFYDDININSYIDTATGVIQPSFDKINISFKYWLILLFLTGNLFKQNNKYNLIFNDFETHVRSILTKPKKEGAKKKKKTALTVRRVTGGSREQKFASIIQGKKQTKQPIKKQNNKKDHISKIYLSLFRDIPIGNRKLNDIYYKSFNDNIKYYFFYNIQNKITATTPPKELDIDKDKAENPFDNTKKVDIKDIINTNILPPPKKRLRKSDLDTHNIRIFLNEFKSFDIFDFLNLLIDPKNLDEIKKFLNDIKSKLLLLLFYLYNIKLIIYKSYITKLSEIFEITIPSNDKTKKGANTGSEAKTETNTRINTRTETKINIGIKIEKKNNISTEIKNIENKIKLIKDDNGIMNSNKSLLLLEEKLKELHIKKYTKQITKENNQLNNIENSLTNISKANAKINGLTNAPKANGLINGLTNTSKANGLINAPKANGKINGLTNTPKANGLINAPKANAKINGLTNISKANAKINGFNK